VLLAFMQQRKAPDRAPAGDTLLTLYTEALAARRYMNLTDRRACVVGGRPCDRLIPGGDAVAADRLPPHSRVLPAIARSARCPPGGAGSRHLDVVRLRIIGACVLDGERAAARLLAALA
jgi:hypothetical protein